MIGKVYEVTLGQPGLVSWFGELLTEKENPRRDRPLQMQHWKRVWNRARFKEPNNTVMNLIAKARNPQYQSFLVRLFTHSDLPFSFHQPVHNYLYLHGILSASKEKGGEEAVEVCRFSSPFVQHCIFHALTNDVLEDFSLLLIPALDRLDDVFLDSSINLPALLKRYQDYLKRLKAKGINPWKEQPRRKTDFHLTESVGHFHLFSWLQNVIGKRGVVSPEFPTGNGKVDLHIQSKGRQGIIEVKSFVNSYEMELAKKQAVSYSKQLGLNEVTIAMFTPIEEEEVLEQLSISETMDDIQVHLVAVSWV